MFAIVFFFFFQAEDGIRDAQESRGLGDVYKRQSLLRDVRDTERRVVLERERQQSAILTVQRWWRGVSAQSLSYGYFISEERRYHAGRYNTWLRGGAGIDCGLLRNAAAAVATTTTVSYTHLRAHETPEHLVCRLLLEKKKKTQ
eukprot:TRINITY_DN50304_c0_g1_i1.p1 TRINITY_DN50304_c0_g1~~TRINITY_DN50304_c0_g1_i1.p1  ORF type:complete len:144 (-),score=48.00 TRINITY_DN50304_c0_g1_i1:65-496(-)